MISPILFLQCHGNPDDDSTDSSGEDEGPDNNMNGAAASSSNRNQQPEPMDEDGDPGWTVVRSRRRN